MTPLPNQPVDHLVVPSAKPANLSDRVRCQLPGTPTAAGATPVDGVGADVTVVGSDVRDGEAGIAAGSRAVAPQVTAWTVAGDHVASRRYATAGWATSRRHARVRTAGAQRVCTSWRRMSIGS